MQNKISSLKETVHKSIDIILQNDKLGFVVKTQITSGLIGAVFTLPLAIAGLVIVTKMNTIQSASYNINVDTTITPFTFFPPVAIALVFVGFLSLIIYGLVYTNIILGTTLLIAKGKTCTIKQIVSQSFARAINMSLHMSLKGLILFVGYILFIIPGILMQIKFMFSEMALIEEDLGPIQALKRSTQLTKGIKKELFLKVLAIVFLQIGLYIILVPFFAISIEKSILPLVGIILIFIMQIIGAIWYFDAVALNGKEPVKPTPLPEPTPEISKPADEPKTEVLEALAEPDKPEEIPSEEE